MNYSGIQICKPFFWRVLIVVTVHRHSFVQETLDTNNNKETFLRRASELLENLEEMYSRYYMHLSKVN